MRFVIVFEAAGDASAALAFRARTIAPDADIVALCEAGAAFPSSACGANEAVEIPFCEDDCVQAQRIADALVQLKPDAVLFPATVRGRFLSAWAAAKLDTGLTADCTDLGLTPTGLLKQISTEKDTDYSIYMDQLDQRTFMESHGFVKKNEVSQMRELNKKRFRESVALYKKEPRCETHS